MKRKKKIVKVQEPKITTIRPNICLVHDRDESHVSHQMIPLQVWKEIHECKATEIYYLADWQDGEWDLIRRVPGQKW